MINLFDAEESNKLARKVNALWNLRGSGGVKVHKAESGFLLEAASDANDWTDYLDGFVWVGRGDQRNTGSPKEYGPQYIRNWSEPGNPYELPDFLGQWYEWRAARGGDVTWRLKIRVPFDFTIHRIEIYQVVIRNGEPYWNTGQTWATDDYIYPLAHQDGSNIDILPDGSFLVYPLKVAHGGSLLGNGVSQNNDYADNLNLSYTAGPHTFYLFGDQNAVITEGQRFRVIVSISTADGTPLNVINGTIAGTPTDVLTEV